MIPGQIKFISRDGEDSTFHLVPGITSVLSTAVWYYSYRRAIRWRGRLQVRRTAQLNKLSAMPRPVLSAFGILVATGGALSQGVAMHGGATCGAMAPFCVDPTAQYHFEFVSSNDQQTPWTSSDHFGCLMTHPGEQWLYLTIQRGGVFAMTTSSSRDHDYAVWGPFASLEAAQRSCGTLPSPADCGYSTSATEHLSIPNVQAGEVYVVLLTNFARVTQALSAELDAANTAVLSCAAVAIKEQQQEASASSAPFTVNSGPCTLRSSASQYCVGRPSGYTNSESCSISSGAAGTLSPCPVFVTERGCT